MKRVQIPLESKRIPRRAYNTSIVSIENHRGPARRSSLSNRSELN